jgi:hypothetical protein
MRIQEVANDRDQEKLAAISQFLLGRAQDEGSTKRVMDFRTFANLAQGQGISLTPDSLKRMIQQPPLRNLINDVEGDDPNTARVIFQGAENTPPEISVDQARQTVNQMAKRALP